MNLLTKLCALILVCGVAACGGGGGSPGSTPTGSTSTTTTATTTVTGGTLDLSLVRADGVAVAGNKLSQTEEMFLQVVLKNAVGGLVDLARVEFKLDSDSAKLVPFNGVALTESGVARIKVSPSSVGATGVITANASATLNGTNLVKDIYISIEQGSVRLENMQLSPNTLQKGQSLVASVDVLVNGVKAASNSVAVSFSSTCGDVSPASAVVNSDGKAVVVVQTTKTGDCQVSANYNGGVSIPGNFTVTNPPTTSIRFVEALPNKIYQSGSPGVSTSLVKFKVLDTNGDGVAAVPVSATLTNTDGGINFCGVPSTAQNTNSDGEVTFSVCSGTLPATVQVRANLDSNPLINSSSNLLTIQTGLPTQRFFDISATQLNYYVGGQFTSRFNNNQTVITVNAADRQGNPVPAGTPIVFVSEGGQITGGLSSSSCVIGSTGSCSVNLVGQEYRPLGSPVGDPRPGRVTVLAYADGEESFVDGNNNNRFDAGEKFEDLGNPFIDKDENGLFTAAYQNLVTGTDEGEVIYPTVGAAIGTLACPTSSNIGLSAQNTCNGQWDGKTRVRRNIVIVFSGGEIGAPTAYHASIPLDKRTEILSASRAGFLVRLADGNGNPLPSTTSLSVEVLNNLGECTAKLLGSSVGNSTEPTEHTIVLDKCVGGETVLFKATVQNKESALSLSVP